MQNYLLFEIHKWYMHIIIWLYFNRICLQTIVKNEWLIKAVELCLGLIIQHIELWF